MTYAYTLGLGLIVHGLLLIALFGFGAEILLYFLVRSFDCVSSSEVGYNPNIN